MPHKPKRKAGEDGDYDFPPTSRESQLSNNGFVSKSKRRKDRKRARRSNWYGANDTPKAFTRMMQLSRTQKGVKGLDGEAETDASKSVLGTTRIRPGERMSDFAARVDRALPIAGLTRRGRRVDKTCARQTRTEKRIQKMIRHWRETGARITQRNQNMLDLAEVECDGQDETLSAHKTAPALTHGSRRKNRKRKGVLENDPWHVFNLKREQPESLHDIVQAPPTFTTTPKDRFKVKHGARIDVADVPNAAGSLRKREELGEARKAMIESYRAIMASKDDARQGVCR